MSATVKTINTGVLAIAYLEYGPASGWPCIMGHGFPYDAHAYDQAAPILADAGARVIVPYLRGYGPTRFLKAETPRSGEQAALGVDLLDFMDALKNRARGSRRLRLGRARRLHRLRAFAEPGRRARLRQFVQHPEHRACHGAGEPSRRGGVLVPILLSQRARPTWSREEPEGDRAPLLAHVVAELGVRRCDLRPNGERLRQPRLRRRRHPFLSASLRPRAQRRRSSVR